MTHVGAHPMQTKAQGSHFSAHRSPRRTRNLILTVCAVALASTVFLVIAIEVIIPPQPSTSLPAPAGATRVGSAAYAVPKNALFVSASGSDSARGTQSDPLRSVQSAIALARTGQTIVLRGGEYHQQVTVTSDKRVTIQPFPHEAVWFDGSSTVSSWTKNGAAWISDGWTATFDSSPTFSAGAPDNTTPGYAFIDPAHPLAAHPDQLWLDGVALTQVAKRGDVTPGTFAVDHASSRLYLGSDPSGHEVRASDKQKAFSVQSAKSVLRGFGVRRYATPVPAFAAITVEAPGVTVDNLQIEDNATGGLFVGAADVSVRHVTVQDNGMIGMNSNLADRLTVSGLLAVRNNAEHFNNAPVSGGFKVTRSRGIVIDHSELSQNFGPGLWFDQSDYDADVLASVISRNRGHGLIVEISSHFVIAGNTIDDNRDNGIKVNNTDHVQIWNNTVASNGADLFVAQDSREAGDPSVPGHDSRRPSPDPTQPWVIGAVVVSNNVFSGAMSTCVVCVQDFSGRFTASQLGVRLNDNAYQRSDGMSPATLIFWAGKTRMGSSFTSLQAFRLATAEESKGVELAFADATERTWRKKLKTSASPAPNPAIIPGYIRKLLGWDDSMRPVGAG
jgi:hypothetical protein